MKHCSFTQLETYATHKTVGNIQLKVMDTKRVRYCFQSENKGRKLLANRNLKITIHGFNIDQEKTLTPYLKEKKRLIFHFIAGVHVYLEFVPSMHCQNLMN